MRATAVRTSLPHEVNAYLGAIDHYATRYPGWQVTMTMTYTGNGAASESLELVDNEGLPFERELPLPGGILFALSQLDVPTGTTLVIHRDEVSLTHDGTTVTWCPDDDASEAMIATWQSLVS